MQYLSLEILANLRQGKKDSLDPIFHTFFASLCYFANKFVDDKMHSEDIVLDTFVKAWERRDTFLDAKNVKAFLYISVKNTCLNHIREKATEKKRKGRIAQNAELIEEDAERLRIKAEVYRMIVQEIDKLPEKCKEIVTRIYQDGLTVSEVAREMGLSESTVRNQKLRGIQIMRKRLGKNELRLFEAIILVTEFLNHPVKD
jgi:RNA polymerase sigma-70 factor, Bacteroides expansion family 1